MRLRGGRRDVQQTQPQLAARSLTLGQLFADPFFVEVPTYQRAFAWTSEEAGRLIEDRLGAMDAAEAATGGANDGVDFLGTLLFIDRDATAQRLQEWPLAGAARAFEVVDGLQRLTTLTILFCALRDLDADEGVLPDPGIIAAIGAGRATQRPRHSLRGEDNAFFQTYVGAPGASRLIPDGDQLSGSQARILEVREKLLASLMELDAAQRRRLARFLLERCYVVMIVTTGIDRAHRMFTVLNEAGKPLARNDILKAELLGKVQPATMAAKVAVWERMERSLDRDFEALFSHVRAMYGRPGAHVIAGIRDIAASNGGADAFIDRVLGPAAAAFDDIRHARHVGSPQSSGISRTLRYLGWLAAADWVPPAMLWWREHGQDAAKLAWFLGALDRLAYGLRIHGMGASRRTQRFGSVIWAIRNGLDLETASSPMVLTRDELRTIHYNLRDLHVRAAPVCKLMLMRLSDQMAGRAQELPLEDLSVEHVLPRKHSQGSEWRRLFLEPQDRSACTESLGNLVLVTKAQNVEASNLDFARKHAIYFGDDRAPAPAINEYLRGQTEWTSVQIRAREADLLRHVDALWGFGVARGLSAHDGAPSSSRRRRPPGLQPSA